MKRLSSSVEQESQAIAARRSVWVGIGALLVGAAGVAGSAALWMGSSRNEWRLQLEPLPENSPLERGLIDVEERGAALQRKAHDELESFAWVDQKRGIVAIPIEDAIKWFVDSAGKATPASTIAREDSAAQTGQVQPRKGSP